MQAEVMTGTRLSLQQKWLWLMLQQQQGQPFHSQCAYSLHGALDPLRLEKAFEQVVKRFDILRTAFHFLPGVALPVQVVTAESAISWQRHDLSKLDSEQQQKAVTSLFKEMLRQPFDLQSAPL